MSSSMVRAYDLRIGHNRIVLPFGSNAVSVSEHQGKITLWCFIPLISSGGVRNYSFLVALPEMEVPETAVYVGHVRHPQHGDLHVLKVGGSS